MAPDASTYDRRTVLKATGGAVGALAAAGTATATHTDPVVETEPATNVTESSATLNGELHDLGGADSARVYFEWVPAGGDDFATTPAETVSSPTDFSHTLTGLASAKTHVYRAVVVASDGDADKGDDVTFTTDEDGGIIL